MIITFPHFGYAYIAFSAAAESIGLEYVVPEKTGSRDIEEGSKLSPETICLPFKVNMGNILNAIKRGADTITFAGGVGPCRFGYYGRGIEAILRDRGINVKVLHLNQRDIPDAYRVLKEARCPKFSFINFVRGFIIMWQKAKAISQLENMKRKSMPYALRRSDVKRAFEAGLQRIDDASSLREVLRARKENRKSFGKIAKDAAKKPLKIGLIGEIFMILEPHVNMGIEDKLAEMGAEVHTVFSLHKWMKYIFHVDLFGKRSFRNLSRLAGPYLSENAGGESRNNVGSAILYAGEGYDGIIHMYPFTCMPGLVGHTVLNRVSRDLDIPILHFSIDEHFSEVGFDTRLEAFVDMLKNRKERQNAALSGN